MTDTDALPGGAPDGGTAPDAPGGAADGAAAGGPHGPGAAPGGPREQGATAGGLRAASGGPDGVAGGPHAAAGAVDGLRAPGGAADGAARPGKDADAPRVPARGRAVRPVRDLRFGAALGRLRDAQKTAKGVSLYSRYVNRPAGRVLAAGAYRAGLTPNQVTLVSAAFSFGGIAALALARPSWGLAAAVYAALAVGFAFDSADGQLARLLGVGGPAGEWLDHVVDAAKITAVHAAVLIAFYRNFDLPGEGWLLLPLGFQLAAVLIFFGGLLTDKLKPKAPRGTPAPAPSPLRAVALLPVDYGVFCAVFLLLGSQRAFRDAYLVLFAVHAVFLAAFLAKWFRELRRI